MTLGNRKRQRIILVCYNCKQRKRKCDRKLPCSFCKLNGLSDSCRYEYETNRYAIDYRVSANNPVGFLTDNGKASFEGTRKNMFPAIEQDDYNRTRKSIEIENDKRIIGGEILNNSPTNRKLEFVNNTITQETTKSILLNMDNENVELFCKINIKSQYRSFVGVNPFSQLKDQANFNLYTAEDVQSNCGTLSWASLMLKDPALKCIWKIIQMDAEIEGNNISQVPSILTLHPQIIKASENIIPGYMTSNKISKENLLNNILEILPSRGVIYDLVEHYFLEVYPFMPFIDERYFKSQVFRILSYLQGEEKFTSIHIYSGCDFAYLGILLIVLKLSYLSLFSNIPSTNEPQEIKSFRDLNRKDSPFHNTKFLQFAMYCVEISESANDDKFPVFLLAFYIKLYWKYAPEEEEKGDGNATQNLNLYVINKAIKMGLSQVSREPQLHNLENDFLKSKIWYFLIFADLSQGYTYGYDACIYMSKDADVISMLNKDSSNLINNELDRVITKFFFKCSVLTMPLQGLLKKVLNHNGCSLSELCTLLDNFEETLDNDIGSFEICMALLQNSTPLENFKRLFTIKYHLSYDVFLITLFWHLYLHFELLNSNLSFFYLKKTFLLILEVYPHCYQLLNRSSHPCDYIINPALEKFINKANQVFFAFLVRLDFKIYSLSEKEIISIEFQNFVKILKQIRDNLIEKIHGLVFSLSNLADVYSKARHIVQTYDYFLKLRSKSNFIESIQNKNNKLFNSSLGYSQSLEIMEILKSSDVSQDLDNDIIKNFSVDMCEPTLEDLAFNLEYDFDMSDIFFDCMPNSLSTDVSQ